MKERLRMRGFLVPETEPGDLDGLDENGPDDSEDGGEGDGPFDAEPGEA
jgi:hypothetical protein